MRRVDRKVLRQQEAQFIHMTVRSTRAKQRSFESAKKTRETVCEEVWNAGQASEATAQGGQLLSY